jgi:NTP pyrophosphatase (non-canonical NTP hydrolase)
MGCPVHPQSLAWNHPEGERCAICGRFFDGRDPPPPEPVIIRSLNHFQQYSMERSGYGQGIFKLDLAYVGLSLAGEGGEAADYVKKVLYHGHELDREKLADEVGDMLWGVQAAATYLGYTLEEIVARNVAKIKRRYPPDGFFNPEQSRNRNNTDEIAMLRSEIALLRRRLGEAEKP